MNSLMKTVSIARFLNHRLAVNTARCEMCKECKTIPNRILKLKQKQKHFQVDNGIPVYLKGGGSDKLLFNLTLLGLAVGMGMSVMVLVSLILKH